LQIAAAALRDTAWQTTMRNQLPAIAAANVKLLQKSEWAAQATIFQHALFNSVALAPAQAASIAERLAQRGIRVRRIEIDAEVNLLRFGLIDPAASELWRRAEQAYLLD
jgi:hypothetical protein